MDGRTVRQRDKKVKSGLKSLCGHFATSDSFVPLVSTLTNTIYSQNSQFFVKDTTTNFYWAEYHFKSLTD